MKWLNKDRPYKKHRPHLIPQRSSLINPKKIIILISVFIIFFTAYYLISLLITQEKLKPEQINWHINGNLPHASLLLLKKQVKPLVELEYFDIDPHKIKKIIQLNSWVDSVIVKRRFWQRIHIGIKIKQAVLRLNNHSYIDTNGMGFTPKYLSNTSLPLAIGLLENSSSIWNNFQQYQNILTPRFPIKVISQKAVTKLVVGNDITLKLGYQQQKQRLINFIAIYHRLLRKYKTLNHAIIDLQYTDAVVVSH